MDESKIQKAPQKLEEQEIDLIELAQKVWADRKMLCGSDWLDCRIQHS